MSRAAWVVLLAVAGGSAWAGDPAALLVEMSEAARKANYQGVIVYQTRDRMETLRVVHGVQDGHEFERVQTLTGAPREVLRRDGKVICLLPKDRKMTIDQPTPKGLFPPLSAERVAQLAEVYEFREIGEERIAGRRCTGLAILPKDRYRYGYEIWADTQTRVPLKVNLVGREGTVLEQMMFTEVEFPERIAMSAFDLGDEDQRISPPQADATALAAQPGASAGPTWRFRQLPPGFRVTMRSLRPTADGKGFVEHVLLTDGLSAVSVFSTHRALPMPPFEGQSRMGAVHAFGRMLGSVHITVVGEAPPETVRLIGESLQPPETAPQPAADSP
ncbi:sigma E regulatory protein, MucB/RseB [Fontimonas thermophila]|uniref:Sigma E regulatory protein, MucB/RseB n=1 Tax=Fontimonas thermophila TaxID=1076937 RepID=A0A1I2JM51_9GAMM|nr:MucB/RseB C-terminal domain-containing protein [Fontimonas thermophila]SFF55188.1 sigma E regulatory protein, MucB/RseB [Fontimonas thermophila]